MRTARILARAALVAAELTGLWLAVGAIAHATMPSAQPLASVVAAPADAAGTATPPSAAALPAAPDAGSVAAASGRADNPAQPHHGIAAPRNQGHQGHQVASRHPHPSTVAPAVADADDPPAAVLAATGIVSAMAISAPAAPAAAPAPGAPMPSVGPLVAAPLPLAPPRPAAAVPPGVRISAAQPPASPIALEAGNGRVVVLDADAANVFVADPKVVEVRPASANSLFVFGVGPGRTTVAAMDASGHMLAQFNVTVRQSGFAAGEAESAIARLMPGNRIGVAAQAKGLLLTGSVSSAGEAARAVAIAHGYLGDGQAIENQINVGAQVQITLRVRIAEMSRSVTRALGVNWQAVSRFENLGRYTVNFATANALSSLVTAPASTLNVGGAIGTGVNRIDANAMIDALAQDNLVRILAEPSMTVMSGETASFLAGGEFPIPVGVQNNTVTIVFKQYGVSLSFVPTVLSDGRINLHVNPEVSELTTQGAVSMPAGTTSISVPALTVRRANTTVELGSGQSFAIAGLLQHSSVQNDTGVPGFGDVPILGALFRSDSFQRNESELVIVVTPYIVRPVNDPSQLVLPTDNIEPAGDFSRILHLRQITQADTGTPSRIPGKAGFIVQ